MIPILIFEGMDKTGKDTLINEIAQLTDYKYVCIDRAVVGFKTYNSILNKSHPASDYDIMEKELLGVSHLMIYCRPEIETIRRRLKEHNEVLPEGTSIVETLKVYDLNYSQSRLNKIVIDTDLSVSECVDIIMHKLNSSIKNVRSKLIESLVVRRYGVGISQTINYEPIRLILNDDDFIGTIFNRDIDAPYYEMVETAVAHIMHKRKLGMLNDRQLIYTSSDCISMIQFGMDQTNELIVHVHQRSLNMAEHAHNDICFIYNMAAAIAASYGYDNVRINYSVAFPHYISKE